MKTLKTSSEKYTKNNSVLTEVFVEEGQRSQVGAEAEELCQHHQPVPGTDGERHHQELGENERGEGDGDHVHELRFEQQQRAIHEDATWWRQRRHMEEVTSSPTKCLSLTRKGFFFFI